MRRFYYNSAPLMVGSSAPMEGDLLHHIRDVCRFRLGSKFELLGEDGRAYLVEISDNQKKQCWVQVLEVRDLPQLKRPWITLCLSMPKFSTFENVIEKSVELGVYQIQPFFSDYSFVKSEHKISEAKQKRFQKIILGATQQSGRGELLRLNDPLSMGEMLKVFNRKGKALGLFAYEGSCHSSLHQTLQTINLEAIDEIWIFVGSEGGFSDMEVRQFVDAGLEPLTLGQQVLRVETACLALISVIKYVIGSFD